MEARGRGATPRDYVTYGLGNGGRLRVGTAARNGPRADASGDARQARPPGGFHQNRLTIAGVTRPGSPTYAKRMFFMYFFATRRMSSGFTASSSSTNRSPVR